LVCSNDGGCYSTLRVLTAAGTHYPVLGNFCHYVNNAISSHLCVWDTDMALLSGDFESLMEIKAAIQKLKDINWLYREVTDESVDEAAKQVVEVTNNTTSTMLEMAGFQQFMIRNLDKKLLSESDIEQYKVLSVKEDPLDN